ncbi:MAG: hypothetical protein ACXVFK_15895 [Solirubrobacteraceae bacterium]
MVRAFASSRRLPAALAAAAALALPAAAAAKPILAVGDQKPAMFSDPRFGWLHITHSRIVVSWTVARTPWERRLVDQWLFAARLTGVRPLVAFGHAWSGRERRALPSVKAYAKAVRDFRRRYPWVRDYTPWNEANHCSQPTCHHPERAAAYYNVMRAQCPRCTIVAADVLDQRNMVPWLRAFRRHAAGHPRLWGLHNYLDANRLRTSGTEHMLKAVRGEIWMTETGGIVRRTHYRQQIGGFEESPAHAAKATAWILKVADHRPRIRRVYLYQWNANSPTQVWDSGLIGPFGETRPAFAVVARAMGRDPSKAPGDQPTQPSPPPPNEQPPASDSSQPSPSDGGSQPQPAPAPAPSPVPVPAPPPCTLPVCPPVAL